MEPFHLIKTNVIPARLEAWYLGNQQEDVKVVEKLDRLPVLVE